MPDTIPAFTVDADGMISNRVAVDPKAVPETLLGDTVVLIDESNRHLDIGMPITGY